MAAASAPTAPAPAPAARHCNATLPSRRGKRRCRRPVYPVQHLFHFLLNWEQFQGFIGMGTVYMIHFVSLLQCDLGVSGAIGEIGVAGGKSFAAMAFTRREGEPIVACDLFRTGVERDNVPDANLPLFLDVLEQVQVPAEDVVILRQSSLQLLDADLVGLAASPQRPIRERVGPYRLFHVDGAHYMEAAHYDLNSAACALVPGGVVLVDDLHNMGYPGVQEGFHRYMQEEGVARSLVPFLWTGRLFLTTPGYAAAYRRAILRAHPELTSVTLYGSQVLSAPPHLLDIQVADFERLLLPGPGGGPPARPRIGRARGSPET